MLIRNKQYGFATLFTGMMVLLGATIAAIAAAQFSLVDWKLSANLQHVTEAHQAADNGLNYGIAWLGANQLADGEEKTLNRENDTANGSTYEITIELEREGDVISARSTAVLTEDESVQSSYSQKFTFTDNGDDNDIMFAIPGTWSDFD